MTEPAKEVWQLLLEARRELLELIEIHARCEGSDSNEYLAAFHSGRKSMRDDCIAAVEAWLQDGDDLADLLLVLRDVQP